MLLQRGPHNWKGLEKRGQLIDLSPPNEDAPPLPWLCLCRVAALGEVRLPPQKQEGADRGSQAAAQGGWSGVGGVRRGWRGVGRGWSGGKTGRGRGAERGRMDRSRGAQEAIHTTPHRRGSFLVF